MEISLQELRLQFLRGFHNAAGGGEELPFPFGSLLSE